MPLSCRPLCPLRILCRLNLVGTLVPHSHTFIEVRVIRHMGGNGGVLAVNRILHGSLPSAHRLHEIIHVVNLVVVTRLSRKGFRGFNQRVLAGQRGRIVPVPLLEVLRPQLCRPANNRIAFRLRFSVLWRKGEDVVPDFNRPLGTIKTRPSLGIRYSGCSAARGGSWGTQTASRSGRAPHGFRSNAGYLPCLRRAAAAR